MDINGTPAGANMSLWAGINYAIDDEMSTNLDKLSEAEKEKVIAMCRDAKSEKEVQKILNNFVPDGNATSLYEEPSSE